MSDEPDPKVALALRRVAAEKNTVAESIALGYRLRVKCLACDKVRPIEMRPLASAGRGDQQLKDLRFKCGDCARARRKMSLEPAGYDTMLRVVFAGEKD